MLRFHLIVLFLTAAPNINAGVAISVGPDDYKKIIITLGEYSSLLPLSPSEPSLQSDHLHFPSGAKWPLSDVTKVAPMDKNLMIAHFLSLGIRPIVVCENNQTANAAAACTQKKDLPKIVKTESAHYISKFSEFNISNQPEIVVFPSSEKLDMLLAYAEYIQESGAPVFLGAYSFASLRRALQSSLHKQEKISEDDKLLKNHLDFVSISGDYLERVHVLLENGVIFNLSKDELLFLSNEKKRVSNFANPFKKTQSNKKKSK